MAPATPCFSGYQAYTRRADATLTTLCNTVQRCTIELIRLELKHFLVCFNLSYLIDSSQVYIFFDLIHIEILI